MDAYPRVEGARCSATSWRRAAYGGREHRRSGRPRTFARGPRRLGARESCAWARATPPRQRRGRSTRAADVRLGGTERTLRWPARAAPSDRALPLVGDFNLENLAGRCAASLVALGIEPSTDRRRRHGEVPAGARPHGARRRADGTRTRRPWSSTTPTRPMPWTSCCARCVPLAKGRLIAVFRLWGGPRSRQAPADGPGRARKSDLAIATSDNPRTEDPAADPDRRGGRALGRLDPRRARRARRAERKLRHRRPIAAEAIARGDRRSHGPEDTVVLAGKGHEDYQIIGARSFPSTTRPKRARPCFAGRRRMSVALHRASMRLRWTGGELLPGTPETRLFSGARSTPHVAEPATCSSRSCRTEPRRPPLRAGRRSPAAPPGSWPSAPGADIPAQFGADRPGHRGRRHHPRPRCPRGGAPRPASRRPGRRHHRQQRQDHHQGDVRTRFCLAGRALPQEPRQPQQRVRLPLTPALARESTDRWAAVVELGMNHRGEIARLAAIAEAERRRDHQRRVPPTSNSSAARTRSRGRRATSWPPCPQRHGGAEFRRRSAVMDFAQADRAGLGCVLLRSQAGRGRHAEDIRFRGRRAPTRFELKHALRQPARFEVAGLAETTVINALAAAGGRPWQPGASLDAGRGRASNDMTRRLRAHGRVRHCRAHT